MNVEPKSVLEQKTYLVLAETITLTFTNNQIKNMPFILFNQNNVAFLPGT